MEDLKKGVLPKAYSVKGRYTILLFIKRAGGAETYRVKGDDGKVYFLKLFNYARLHKSSFNEDGNLFETEILKTVNHPSIVTYRDSGEFIHDGSKFGFLVLSFIAGETLAEHLTRQKLTSAYDLKHYVSSVLQALHYLHTLPECIIHNEVTLSNVMLDLSGNIPQPLLIDFGYARPFALSKKDYNKEGLSPFYLAPECFSNIYSTQTDLFSVGALMYQLMVGFPPWFRDLSKFQTNRRKVEEIILEERTKPLMFDNVKDKLPDYDESLNKIVSKALHPDTEIRFKTAQEFLLALNGDVPVEEVDHIQLQKATHHSKSYKTTFSKREGAGFAAIAGMTQLKELLQEDVIGALNNPEEYEKYGISIPNGMLLYGPPGCGKTFFAQKLAEEVGFNFFDLKPSNLQSKYINATQENIKLVFEEAEKNAPTIIFIDEFDALVPNREVDLHQMHANAVNELLAQMSNCGEKGIFIIAATNRPEKIDPAVLRTGRLDKKIYLPPPDFEARKTMFQLYLKNRFTDFGIEYESLATRTESYVSADIKYLIDEAARKARREKTRISMTLLLEIIQNTKPSVPIEELRRYETLSKEMNGDKTDAKTGRPRIGFR